jgi:hypothetical protein
LDICYLEFDRTIDFIKTSIVLRHYIPVVSLRQCQILLYAEPTIRHDPRAHGDPDGRGGDPDGRGFHDDDVLHRDDGRVRNDDHGARARDYDVHSFLLVLW